MNKKHEYRQLSNSDHVETENTHNLKSWKDDIIQPIEIELKILELKLDSIQNIYKILAETTGTHEYMHSLRIINATIPFGERLIIVTKDTKKSFQNITGTSNHDKQWLDHHLRTMNREINIAKDLFKDADKCIYSCFRKNIYACSVD